MVAPNDDELRRRLARLEVLATLAFLGPDFGTDDETRHLLSRFLRDYERLSGRGGDEFRFLIDRLARVPSSRLGPMEFQGRQTEVNQELEQRVAALQENLSEVSHKIESRVDGLSEFQGRQTGINQELEQRVGTLWDRSRELSHKIESLEKTSFALSVDTHRWLAFQSLGIDASEVRLTRFLPLRVFLSDTSGGAIDDISSAIGKLLEAFDFEISDDFPAVHGSWFKKWFAKTTEVMTQPEVLERLEKIERAVELKGLGQPQAEIDKKQAEAVASLLKAVEKVPNAAIQVGSILLVKLTASDSAVIQVRTLTQRELIHLENNQRLLSSPADLLEKLSEVCQAPERTRPAELPHNEANNLKQRKARPKKNAEAGNDSRQS